VAVVAFGLVINRAEAQLSYGVTPFGPYVGFTVPQTSPTTDYINQLAVTRAQAVGAQRNQAMGAVDNSNAYYNKVRDPGFFERYDYATRRRLEDEVARRPSTSARATAKPAKTGRVTPPTRPLADFFDRSGLLSWPSDAPTEGDLGTKRALSDRASQEVLAEYNERGRARVATATTARTKLLDYGRPALDYLRRGRTSAVSELFHAFLLSLYDSLERAATPPPPPKP